MADRGSTHIVSLTLDNRVGVTLAAPHELMITIKVPTPEEDRLSDSDRWRTRAFNDITLSATTDVTHEFHGREIIVKAVPGSNDRWSIELKGPRACERRAFRLTEDGTLAWLPDSEVASLA